jgi:hypothetical protein
VAVDRRLALAEQIEVRAVQDEDKAAHQTIPWFGPRAVGKYRASEGRPAHRAPGSPCLLATGCARRTKPMLTDRERPGHPVGWRQRAVGNGAEEER